MYNMSQSQFSKGDTDEVSIPHKSLQEFGAMPK